MTKFQIFLDDHNHPLAYYDNDPPQQVTLIDVILSAAVMHGEVKGDQAFTRPQLRFINGKPC